MVVDQNEQCRIGVIVADVVADVTGPRKPRGLRHRGSRLLTGVLVAVLAGACTTVEMPEPSATAPAPSGHGSVDVAHIAESQPKPDTPGVRFAYFALFSRSTSATDKTAVPGLRLDETRSAAAAEPSPSCASRRSVSDTTFPPGDRDRSPRRRDRLPDARQVAQLVRYTRRRIRVPGRWYWKKSETAHYLYTQTSTSRRRPASPRPSRNTGPWSPGTGLRTSRPAKTPTPPSTPPSTSPRPLGAVPGLNRVRGVADG
ncbi:hypothetical protein GCM10023322_50770 [Rugosimonospora acidiphila]|uniref:Uncharacterized protein n=1 Tax=Rugosimonospora acidiphila TaxID=556531 RepID=A0ABP9S7G9_9ACTN